MFRDTLNVLAMMLFIYAALNIVTFGIYYAKTIELPYKFCAESWTVPGWVITCD